jgi:uncharacterized membrane protein YjgN (DUF898 family)
MSEVTTPSQLNFPQATGGSTEPRHHLLRIEFTGSGSEYFRIWLVNLLLTLVTLGWYFPWAKVRRLRYFHGNTLVDGEPLDFHGDPKKMLKGFLLVGLMFGLYSVAGKFSPTAGFIAFLIVAGLWPALLKSSMQFRLANTSWRGMRFRFVGSVSGAYAAVLPLFVPSLVIVGGLVAVDNPDKPPMWYGVVVLGVGLISLAVLPWLIYNLKQYQHKHYAYASLQTSFLATLGAFYKVTFKTIGVTLLAALFSAGLIVGLFFIFKPSGAMPQLGMLSMLLVPVLAMFAVLAAFFVVAKPYVTSRLQNLVWTRTGNRSLRFRSELSFQSLMWLSLKNWALVVLTLGLYWPFAAVAVARLRLEAVTIKTRQHPDSLFSSMSAMEGDAAGDAAGDLLGLDIGL